MHELHDQPEGRARIGDAAGEHLTMRRGQYSAWAYVIGAMIVHGLIALAFLHALLEAFGVFGDPALVVGALLGVGLVVATCGGYQCMVR